MKKILIAVDGSDNALNAVDYAGKYFCGGDIHVVLFHVLPFIPAEFWDDGHILTDEEKKARKNVVDKWLSNQELNLDPIFSAAKKMLNASGIGDDRISTKWISDSTDIATSISEEALSGDYKALVIGRCGRCNIKNRMGSVTEKVIRQGAGTTLCIVD